MTVEQKKMMLLGILQAEYERLPKYNGLGMSNHLEQYPLCFDFLINGTIPETVPEEYLTLYGLVNDFEDTFNIYFEDAQFDN